MMTKKAIILFSGGLDSTTCLAIAKHAGFECYALSFSYGQKHSSELKQALKTAKAMGVIDHKIVDIPIGQFGGSSLTDASMAVSDYNEQATEIPSTYVPARNTIFLSFALCFSEVIGASDVFIGANDVDYSGYPDCRPEYLAAYEKMARLAAKDNNAFTIHAPLLRLTKAEIIKEGMRLGVDYAKTVSCYRADTEGRACGSCDSCVYRKKGFSEAGVADPTLYI